MPPNNLDVAPFLESIDVNCAILPASVFVKQDNNYLLKVFQSSASVLAHVLTGLIVGLCIVFTYSYGTTLSATGVHIILCVIGYQLLMAEAILCLCPEGGWSARLTLVHRRRIHTWLQLIGSVLAIVGSIIKIIDKIPNNFNSMHGIFGLIALIFTGLSLLNGLTSLYAYELRNFLPGNLSKVTHICFGVIAFVAAAVCLIYGFMMGSFTKWATVPLRDSIIGFTVVATFIIIVNPLITFYSKAKIMVS